MNVMIVFLDKFVQGEERYCKTDWIEAEKQATRELINGRIKTANSIDEMFEQIEGNSNED